MGPVTPTSASAASARMQVAASGVVSVPLIVESVSMYTFHKGSIICFFDQIAGGLSTCGCSIVDRKIQNDRFCNHFGEFC